MWKKYLIAVSLFSIATLWFVSSCFPEHKTINITIHGNLYDMANEGTAVSCNITVDGKYYTSVLKEDHFTGKVLVVSEPLELEIKMVKLNFSYGAAIPIAVDEFGYQYTSRIHSIIQRENFSKIVIVLYNEYKIDEGKLIANIDESCPLFICLGKISKEEALNLICEYY